MYYDVSTYKILPSRTVAGSMTAWSDETTLTRSLNLLERDRVIERVPHSDGRIKALRLTSKGRRALETARPLWARAQDKVLRELGTTAWADAQRRLAHLLRIAVKKRKLSRGRRQGQPRSVPRRRSLVPG